MPTQNRTETPLGLFEGRPRPRLYDATINVLRVHHYSLRTERVRLQGNFRRRQKERYHEARDRPHVLS